MPRAAAATEFAVAGGAATAVAIHGSTAWVAVGAQVLAFDLSDPARPAAIGIPLPLPEVAEDMALDDGVLYAVVPGSGGATGARLLAWDVSRPSRPRFLGAPTPLPARKVGAIAVARGLAGVVTDDGVLVVDVKDPARPIVAGRVQTGSEAFPRSAAGDIAMLGEWTLVARPWGLYAFDLADPTSGSLRSIHDRPTRGVAATDEGDRAFAVLEDGAIEEYTFRESAGEVVRAASHAGLADRPLAIAADGGRLHVIDGNGRRLQSFDTTVPVGITPLATASLAAHESSRGAMATSGGRSLFALEPAGIGFFGADGVDRIARPEPKIVPPIVHAATVGSRTFGAAGVAGLYAVDGAGIDGTGPDATGPDLSRGIEIVVGAGGWRAAAVDREGHAAPADVRAADVQAVAAAGGVVFACLGKDGIAAVDGALPLEGALLGHMAEGPTCQSRADMIVARGRLYYVTTEHGLAVVDVTEPRAMRLTHEADDLGIMAIAAGRDGSLLATGYVGAITGILRIFDIGDPDRPEQIGHRAFDRPFGKLAVAGPLAMLSGGFGHLAIVDVADPTRPIERATIGGIAAGKVALNGGILYAAQPGWIDTLLVGAGGRVFPIGRAILPWTGEDWIGASDVVSGGAGDGRLVILRGRAGLYFSGDADEHGARSDTGGVRPASHVAYLPIIRGDDAASSRESRDAPLPPGGALSTGPVGPPPTGPLRPLLTGEPEPTSGPQHPEPTGCRSASRVILAVDTSADMAPLWRPDSAGRPAMLAALQGAIERMAGAGTTVALVRFDRQAELIPLDAGSPHFGAALDRLAEIDDRRAARLDLALSASREAGSGLSGRGDSTSSPDSAIVIVSAGRADPRTLALAERQARTLRANGTTVRAIVGTGRRRRRIGAIDRRPGPGAGGERWRRVDGGAGGGGECSGVLVTTRRGEPNFHGLLPRPMRGPIMPR